MERRQSSAAAQHLVFVFAVQFGCQRSVTVVAAEQLVALLDAGLQQLRGEFVVLREKRAPLLAQPRQLLLELGRTIGNRLRAASAEGA